MIGNMFSKGSAGLEYFDVSSNDLEHCVLEDLESLNYFNARINLLTSISIQRCDSLVYFDASYNELTRLPELLFSRTGNEKMQFVYLRSNHIEEILPTRPFLPNLIILDLSNNLLHSPKPVVHFQRNHTNCSCPLFFVNLEMNNFTVGVNYEIEENTHYLMASEYDRVNCWVQCCNGGHRPDLGESVPDRCLKKSTKILKPQQNYCDDDQFLKGFKVCVNCFSDLWTPVLYDTPLSFSSQWGATVALLLKMNESVSLGTLGYCSKCEDGNMGMDFIKVSECHDPGKKVISVKCAFPCRFLTDNSDAEHILQGLHHELTKGNSSMVSDFTEILCSTSIFFSPVAEYRRFVLWDWFFRYILNTRSFYFTLNYDPPTEICSSTRIWNIFEIIAHKILMNSPPKSFDIVPINGSASNVFMSEQIPKVCICIFLPFFSFFRCFYLLLFIILVLCVNI
jgi:hypothetical protein